MNKLAAAEVDLDLLTYQIQSSIDVVVDAVW